MKPRKPIPRTTRVKPSNPKRRKKAFARSYGSPARVAFVQGMACVVGRLQEIPKCHGDIQVAHTETGGMGRKADAAHTVPLCNYHHANLHLFGKDSFELAYHIDLAVEAEKTELAWQIFQSPVEQLVHDVTNREASCT